MIKKLLLLFLCMVLALILDIYLHQPPSLVHSSGTPVQVDLEDISGKLRPFTALKFPANQEKPKGVILFGSGDGGWGAWEDFVCRDLQAHGYTVMGIDSSEFAKNDYDLPTLQANYAAIARAGMETYKSTRPPLIVGGWSMGAAQAIAVGGGPDRPPGLVGLLLISPSSRGRYGLRMSDRVDILPTGPGTFAVTDFIPGLNGLRIVQWHGGYDIVDSKAWLTQLKTPHQEHDFPGVGHDYSGAVPLFRQKVAESADWIVDPNSPP